MSASTRSTDIIRPTRHVRFVPNPDSCGAAKHLIRHLVGAGEQRPIDVGSTAASRRGNSLRAIRLGARSASGKVNVKEAFIAFGNSIVRAIVTASAPFRNAGHRMELFPRMPWTR